MSYKIKDLNDLAYSSKYGIHKRWIYRDKFSYVLSSNYLQKISFSISDYNEELELLNKEPKDIVFMILLANWIKDSITALFKTYKKEVIQGYAIPEMDEEKAYLEAIRSFVVAHPMSTNRHPKFNFDGSMICSDIYLKDKYLYEFMRNDSVYHLNFDGLYNGKGKYDYLLKVYTAENEMKYFKYICCKFDDITKCVSKYVDVLYDFSLYLGKLRKIDFKEA